MASRTVRNGGADLVWIGQDPAKPEGGPVKIEAKIGRENGSSARNRLVLQISMMPYADPTRAPTSPAPAVSGGPRL